MPSIGRILLAGFVIALIAPVLLTPRIAAAQVDTAPARIDNHANGRDYQPALGETQAREQSAGVLPDAHEQARTDRTVDAIDRQLLGGAPGASPATR